MGRLKLLPTGNGGRCSIDSLFSHTESAHLQMIHSFVYGKSMDQQADQYDESMKQLDGKISGWKEKAAGNRFARLMMGEGKNDDNHFAWHKLSDSRKLIVLVSVLILLVLFLIGSEILYTWLVENPYLPPPPGQ